jgi:hypothetical protein
MESVQVFRLENPRIAMLAIAPHNERCRYRPKLNSFILWTLLSQQPTGEKVQHASVVNGDGHESETSAIADAAMKKQTVLLPARTDRRWKPGEYQRE